MRYFIDENGIDPPRLRILICGGRNYKDWMKVRDYLDTVSRTAIIIHGGATGADSIAGNLATYLNMKVIKCIAEWDKYGKAAGVLRNQQRLDEAHPDLNNKRRNRRILSWLYIKLMDITLHMSKDT